MEYPKWMFTILTNDFGDSYWYDNKSDDPAFKEAMLKLRALNRKYSEFSKWRKACDIYDAYIDVIVEYNGGEYAVKSMLNAGIVPEGWTPRPRLKKTKTNKEIMATGIIPAHIDMSAENTSFINEIVFENLEQIDDIENKIVKPKDETKKAIKTAVDAAETSRRVSSMYKDTATIDVLSKYFENLGKEESSEESFHFSDFLDDVAEELVREAHDDGWVYTEDSDKRHMIFERNTIRTWSDNNAINIAKEIYENNGIVSFDIKTMPKDKARLYRAEFGMTLDNKGMKKQRKLYNEYERDRRKKINSERDLAKVLTRNHGDVDTYDDTFTINDYRNKYK